MSWTEWNSFVMVGVAVLRMLLSRKTSTVERLRAVRARTRGTPVIFPVPSLLSPSVGSPASPAGAGGTDAAIEGTSESRTGCWGCVRLGLRELALLGCCSVLRSAKGASSCEDGTCAFSIWDIVG